MSFFNIQLIKQEDLDGRAIEANKKINFNLKQINKEVELLPDDLKKTESERVSELYYFRQIYECISRNSKLIGFKYPDIEMDFSFSVNTKDKIYEPINSYFKSLIKP
ncbi:hypothetical protein ABE427_02450 [Acinetobacter higginsii]|uniref:hypothetical protein n=1 Tax=Acinetobacter higginsii TaxID=70347 RepID=UPI003208D534